jgi:hypothetical protein
MPIVINNAKLISNKYYISLLKKLKSEPNAPIPEGYNIDAEIDKLLKTEVKLWKEPATLLTEILTSFKKNMRVLSLSRNNDNVLMWGHYADSQRGIVIGFKKASGYFSIAKNVDYSDKIYKLDGGILDDPFLYNEKSRNELNKLLLTKSIDWEYENESRCIFDVEIEYKNCVDKPLFKEHYPQLVKKLKNHDDYIDMPFSTDSIDSIYLGVNIKEDNKKRFLALIKSKYPNTKVYQGTLSQKEFKIIFNKINS